MMMHQAFVTSSVTYKSPRQASWCAFAWIVDAKPLTLLRPPTSKPADYAVGSVMKNQDAIRKPGFEAVHSTCRGGYKVLIR